MRRLLVGHAALQTEGAFNHIWRNSHLAWRGVWDLAGLVGVTMQIQVDPSALGQTKWHEYAARFLVGGLITAAAGIVAKKFGPSVGGLFLAIFAILTCQTMGNRLKRRRLPFYPLFRRLVAQPAADPWLPKSKPKTAATESPPGRRAGARPSCEETCRGPRWQIARSRRDSLGFQDRRAARTLSGAQGSDRPLKW